MTDTQLSLIVSFIALGLSAVALGWNIFRDIALRAIVGVTIDKMSVVQGGNQRGPFLWIKAVNKGPGPVVLRVIEFRAWPWHMRLFRSLRIWWLVRWLYDGSLQGAIMHDWTNPHGDQLPKKLEVGEQLDLPLPWDRNSGLSKNPSHVGIRDSFGRVHWAPSTQLKEIVKKWKTEFADD